MQIDVVDIDPKVIELTYSHFHLEREAKTNAVARDGRMFERAAQESYDCILLDAFTIGGRIPFHLVTREFFNLCSQRMTDDGVFVMNINSAIEGEDADIFRSIYRTLREVFPQVYVFQKGHANGTPLIDSTNIIFVAALSKEAVSLEQWQLRASKYSSRSYMSVEIVERLVGNLVEELPDVSAAPICTDDYAPIETMSF